MNPDLADFSHPMEQYWRDLIGPDELEEDTYLAKVPNQCRGLVPSDDDWGD